MIFSARGAQVSVELDDDGVWQSQGVALLDFEDKSGTCVNGSSQTNTHVKGTAPAGNYAVVKFRIGVPQDINNQNPAEAGSPLNLTAMSWTWAFGYKFMRLDVKPMLASPDGGALADGGQLADGGPFADGGQLADGAVPPDGAAPSDAGDGVPQGPGGDMLFHLGANLCTGDLFGNGPVSCARPNRPSITIADFDLELDKIVLDFAALVEDVDFSRDKGGAPGCMSGEDDPECAATFPKLGLSLATGLTNGTQNVFFKRAR